MQAKTLILILIFFSMAIMVSLIVKGMISDKGDYIAGAFLFGFLTIPFLGIAFAECE